MPPRTALPRETRFRKGYDPVQVDRFLARVRAALDGEPGAPRLTGADVRRVGFPLVRGGYVVAAVDSHLDDVEERVVRADGASPVGSAPARPALLAEVLSGARGRRFPRVRWWHGGYSRREVDAFLDGVVAALTGGPRGSGLDPAAVRQAVFHLRRGGYDETAVDDALDLIVDLLLRRRVASPG